VLPFSSLDFYLLFALLVALLYGLKPLLKPHVTVAQVLLGISLFYVLVYFPKPLQLCLFTVYQCTFTWLLLFRWKKVHGLLGTLLIALPMLLVKLNWHTELIGFAGISYITFRCIQVYLDGALLRNEFRFVAFVGFLLFPPSLLAGPIDRYQRFKSDLDQGWSRLDRSAFMSGWQWLVLGLLHKFVLAEVVARYWLAQGGVPLVGWPMLSDVYAYTAYLYFDFAGYSLLAIGLGRMMGIDLPKNFDRPWLTQNPPEFWKRWHISLGDWLRDYFFRPIYKSLSGVKALRAWPCSKQNVALFSTFLLMGCWNGLEVHYVLSGALFGFYSVVYNTYQYHSRKRGWKPRFALPPRVARTVSIFVMGHLACFALYVFSGRMHLSF
jgi:membrane protein involved in D-alanine export